MDRRILLLLISLLAALPGHAVELIGAPKIEVETTRATLRWNTDLASGTRLQYGKQAHQLDQKVEGPVTEAHEVVLKDLAPDTLYYYTLGSARQKLSTGSFKTTRAGDSPPPSPATVEAKKSILGRVIDLIIPSEKAGVKEKAVPEVKVAPAQSRAPPARQTWGRWETLQDHYDRHGADFASRSPEDYAAQAWHFLQRAKAGELPMKWDDSDQSLRVYDPKTLAFAAYNRDGTAKTFFRPNNPSYWQRQPGRAIRSTELRF